MDDDYPEEYFKYRGYSAQSLAALINRELYFASPAQLNDPHDCQLNIPEALEAAVVAVSNMKKLIKMREQLLTKLEQFGKLETLYQKIASDWGQSGVLSLSEVSICPLMWTHYADEHRGFCMGFELQAPFVEFNNEHQVIGRTKVGYPVCQ